LVVVTRRFAAWRASPAWSVVAVAGLSWALAGCQAKIGAHCLVSTDCANNGTRVCDTSQPDGYCTVFNCTDDSCPDNAACVTLQPAVPGCSYNDYDTPSRASRTLCLAHCNSDSDCRTDNGYICANPRNAPWHALILDNNQNEQVCIVAPTPGYGDAGAEDAEVCTPGALSNSASGDGAAEDDAASDATVDVVEPDVLASFDAVASFDATESGSSLVDAPAEAETPATDAGSDGGLDAAFDAGLDAASDDAGPDAATLDAAEPDASDAGVPDAPSGD
jgi:hypothetical protein